MAADFNDPNLTRLMIVDDDEIVLSSAKEQLTLLGYHVTAVNHPQLALQHLQTENFSVILADYEMPEMDGLQLFGVIEESHPDTSRLIFSSGIGMMELSEAIASGRVYRHVSKPWLKEDMQATVGNAMERYHPQPETRHRRRKRTRCRADRRGRTRQRCPCPRQCRCRGSCPAGDQQSALYLPPQSRQLR
jgi:DNA-binding NtrC family response regulator